MEMPKPTSEHLRLSELSGTWEGEETIFPTPYDPKGGKAKGRRVGRIGLGGFHLISDYQQERNGKVNFEGHGVFGWDPRGKCYTMHWFDNLGIEHGAPYYGTWEGNTLTITHETTHMGFSRTVMEMGEGEYTLKLQMSKDGRTWQTFIEGRYRRVKAAEESR